MDGDFSDKRAGMVIAVDRNTGAGSGSMFPAAEQTRFYAGLSGQSHHQSCGSVFGLLVSVSDAFCGALDCGIGICSLAVGGMDLPEMFDWTAESVFIFSCVECRLLFRRYGLQLAFVTYRKKSCIIKRNGAMLHENFEAFWMCGIRSGIMSL